MRQDLNFTKCLRALIFLMLALGLSVAYCSDNQLTIAKGNTAYSSGKYQEAIDTYMKVADQGLESPDLYYNLGNAYFKLNDIPHAILWYERARKINPGSEDINFNLSVANSKITDKIEPLPEFFIKRWLRSLTELLSIDAWATGGIVFLILALLFFSMFIASRVLLLRKLGFWSGFASLILAAVFLLFSWGSYRSQKSDQSAVILNPTVTVKSSPDEKSTDIFVIHEGCKIQLLDHIGNWYEVRIANGSVGWVEQGNFEKI
ncbi:MAG: tetratricopeptide repeat protein [Bacteroidota bacterium]